MKRIIALLVVASLMSGSFALDTPSPPRDATDDVSIIEGMEAARLEAGLRKDVEAVSRATADDYMQIDADGNVLSKAAAMARIKSNYAKLRDNPVSEMVVRIYGDTAILTGLGRPQGTIDGKASVPIRYTRVYVRRNNQWQVVHFQQTRLTELRDGA